MELVDVTIQGFRRFSDPTSVRLQEDLIAVVGPNEAGKSSFLLALQELNTQEEVSRFDQTRDSDVPTKISARFLLDESDETALRDIRDGEDINHCTFEKHENGTISMELDPEPSHDFEPRSEASAELETLKDDSKVWNSINQNIRENIEFLIDELPNSDRDLSTGTMDKIDSLRRDLVRVVDEDNADFDRDKENKIRGVIGVLERLLEHERAYAPTQARDVLRHRRPKFLLFEDEDRTLDNEYDLEKERGDPPKALQNLCRLADLDLHDLYDAATDYTPRAEDMIEEANEILEGQFSRAWIDEDVVPVLAINDTILSLMVRTPGERNRTKIKERSDGLRWFVALLAFMNYEERRSNPILLVDEAESHLSYDAQASLIEVLETQELAQKVIYTTHSAGCLPSDLGTGIRPIIPKEGERSEIKNGFWSEGQGFSPLMMAMGLSPLAFTVGRNALIAEGPSEMLLMPSLIREVADQETLDFQIAPGVASMNQDDLPELLSESGRAVIVLDGDEAGESRKDVFSEAIDDTDRIRTLRDFSDEPLVFEDLIEKEAYVEAYNEVIHTWDISVDELEVSELPEVGRTEYIDNRSDDQRVHKTVLCQHLAEVAARGNDIVAPEREEVLVQLFEWADEYFIEPQEYITT